MREITVKVSGSKGRHASGTVWRPGLIITNAHVANSQVHDVEFAAGMKAPAWLVARDRELDLAALAVSATFARIANIRSASRLRAGEMVLALGNPFDGRGSVTTGIVHCPVASHPGFSPILGSPLVIQAVLWLKRAVR